MPTAPLSACPSEPEEKSMPGTSVLSGWSPSGFPRRVRASSTSASKNSCADALALDRVGDHVPRPLDHAVLVRDGAVVGVERVTARGHDRPL